jgi:hypothetical protein
MEIYTPKSHGEISIGERFVSLRHVKEALEAAFNFQVDEETSSSIKGRIVRLARVYGAPIVWPNATVEVNIDNENDILSFTFCWPDYYMLFFTVVLLFMVSTSGMSGPPLFFYVVAPAFHLLMIYLDTLYVKSRVKRYLLKQIVS